MDLWDSEGGAVLPESPSFQMFSLFPSPIPSPPTFPFLKESQTSLLLILFRKAGMCPALECSGWINRAKGPGVPAVSATSFSHPHRPDYTVYNLANGMGGCFPETVWILKDKDSLLVFWGIPAPSTGLLLFLEMTLKRRQWALRNLHV